MTDLVEWLREQIAEDEADAEILDSDSFWLDYAPDGFGDALDRQRAKLSAECAAKRAILDHLLWYQPKGEVAQERWKAAGRAVLLRLLAQPYIAAGRPGFDPAWRVA